MAARTSPKGPPIVAGSVQVSKGSQSLTYVELLRIGGVRHSDGSESSIHRLRISIKSDSYREQSHARVERWDGNAWREVYTIAPGSMATREGLYVQRFDGDLARREAFRVDRDTLIARAAEVLL